MSAVAVAPAPYLSFSRVDRYVRCPESYRLYYIEGLRPLVPPATLTFGSIVHQSLAGLLKDGEDPVSTFTTRWAEVRDTKLDYGAKASWESLATTGQNLLELFVDEELPRIQNVEAVEKPFRLEVTSLDLPLVGVVDLVATVDAKKSVVDFKTSASSYGDHEAQLSDQLSAYRLAEPAAAQGALCVLVKTKTPKIEWRFTTRTADDLKRYLAKLGMVAEDIAAGRYFRRTGMWCSWCEFLPVCTGNTAEVKKTLVRVG